LLVHLRMFGRQCQYFMPAGPGLPADQMAL